MSISKWGIIKEEGRFRDFSGRILYDPGNPELTQVEFTVQTHIIAVLVAAGLQSATSQDSAPFPPPPPSTVSSTAVMAGKDKPGSPLVISGTVFRSDRRTPFGNLVLFFYQTDDSGMYNRTDNSYRTPRLHGWVKTDKAGRYRIQTIKPGSYPGRRDPAHIHVTVKLPGSASRWLDDFLFADNPKLSPSLRELPKVLGRFSHVLELSAGSGGTLVGERDIIVQD